MGLGRSLDFIYSPTADAPRPSTTSTVASTREGRADGPDWTMALSNAVVAGILRSPLHPVLSAKVQLIRYRGTRTGHDHVTPTQYAELGDGTVMVLVGRPDTKTWWRNFRHPHPVDLLIRGTWLHGTGHARRHRDDPVAVEEALAAFGAKYGQRHSPSTDTDPLVVLVHLDDRRPG